MRHFLWVLLAGLMASAMAQAQDDAAIEQLATDTSDTNEPLEEKETEDPSQKTAQGILKAVEAVVASLTPETPVPEPPSDPEEETDGTRVVDANEPVPSETEEETPEETSDLELTEPSKAVEEEVIPTEPTAEEPVPEDTLEEEPPKKDVKLTKKERKAVSKYNTAIDQVLVILSKSLNEVGAIPIALDEQSLLALDEAEELPEPEPETPKTNNTRKNRPKGNNKKNKKNKRKNNRKNQNKKNKSVNKSRGQRRNKNNSAENNNKNSGEKGNNKKNKNNNNNSGEKNNNNNKRKNKNNKNKRNNKRNDNKNNKQKSAQLEREPKALEDNEQMEGVVHVEEGRRKSENKKNENNRKGNKRKNKKNKNKNKKIKSRGRVDLEGREQTGPALPTPDEHSAANARLTGLAMLTRDGDVTVDLSGKRHQVEADITIGPLEVNLKDETRALTKAQVTATLSAVANFKVKSVRGRNKLSLVGIDVTELLPEEVAVTRNDLELETEVITEAQQQVVGAVDTARVGRILSVVINNILDTDNVIENLEDHPFLQRD